MASPASAYALGSWNMKKTTDRGFKQLSDERVNVKIGRILLFEMCIYGACSGFEVASDYGYCSNSINVCIPNSIGVNANVFVYFCVHCFISLIICICSLTV